MAIATREFSWRDFKGKLSEYGALPLKRRGQIYFRGQPDSGWPLQTTLDRARDFASPEDRDAWIDNLVREFMHESVGLKAVQVPYRLGTDWELLGRHHGLPAPYLDWTTSPYIATYFAYAEAERFKSDCVAVWTIDRGRFADIDTPQITLLADDEWVRFNTRAIEQRGVFIRVNDTTRPLEEVLEAALFRFDLPRSDLREVLSDLDEMGINARTMFRDLDGAARSAACRLLQLGDD